MSKKVELYHTEGCHLCELAEEVMCNVAAHYPLSWTKKDIANDNALVDAYGTRIPVLVCIDTGRELGWPFDEQALYEWLVSDA